MDIAAQAQQEDESNMDIGEQAHQGDEVTINEITDICCIGATKVGVFSMLVMASHWPEKRFFVVDDNPNLIESWQNGTPYFEPGLEQLLNQRRGVNVHFGGDMFEVLNKARIIFIAVDMEIKMKRKGKEARVNLGRWEEAIRTILQYAQASKFIVEKSSFPPAVPSIIDQVILTHQSVNQVFIHQIFSNPEFSSQGTALQDLENPPRVIIASKTLNANVNLIADLYNANNLWVPNERIITNLSSKSVELARAVSNAALAMHVALMDMTMMFCDKIGADISEVQRIVCSDPRIGPLYLRHGASIGRPGLIKDVSYLKHLADKCNMDSAAMVLRGILSFEESFKGNMIKVMLDRMISLQGKTIAIMGFSYEENTSDIYESAARYICERLWKHEGALIRIYDPQVPNGVIKSCFPAYATANGRGITIINANDMASAWMGAHAICILQRWDEFAGINFGEAIEHMHRPAYLFDACNLYPDNVYTQARISGFCISVLGRPGL